MGNGLIQVVAGAHIKYVDNIPFVLLGLKPSGVWEFPGGKVDNDETHSQAMEREWIEELGVMVKCDEENGIFIPDYQTPNGTRKKRLVIH